MPSKSRQLVKGDKTFFCTRGSCGIEFMVNTERELNLKLKLHRKKCVICDYQIGRGLVEYTEENTCVKTRY